MLLDVAIIEDQPMDIEVLKEVLGQWAKKHRCVLQISTFSSGEEFLEDEKSIIHDVVILDIQLKGIDGLDIAKNLRQNDFQGSIIFLTNFREYVFQGYDVRALQYLVKPVQYEMIEKCMNIVCMLFGTAYYTFSFKNNVEKLSFHEILYFSSDNHYIDIHTKERIYSHKAKFKDIIATLPSQFVQCHRSIILNVNHIEKIEKNMTYLSNGETQPISDTYLNSIRNAILHIMS